MTIFFAVFSVIFLGFSLYWWWKYETAQSEIDIRKEYIEYLHTQLDDNAQMVAQLEKLEHTMSEIEMRSITVVEFSDN